MRTSILPKLTPRDFAILEMMLADHLGGDERLISAIRKKLKLAQIVFAEDLPGNLVTVGSRVAFTVDNQWPQERRLVPVEHYVAGQDHQILASLRGIGLLGQTVGDRVEIDFGSRVEQLEIHKVLYQPEAESKTQRQAADMHLVSDRKASRSSGAGRPDPLSDDDPGPSAA